MAPNTPNSDGGSGTGEVTKGTEEKSESIAPDPEFQPCWEIPMEQLVLTSPGSPRHCLPLSPVP